MKNRSFLAVSMRNFFSPTKESTMRGNRLAYLKVLAFFGVCLFAIPLPAQNPGSNASATITFANGTLLTIRGRDQLRRIGILPGETITIQLQLPAQFANTIVAAQALDGGAVSGDVTIAADGTGSVGFQGGTQPGLYRILLNARGRSATLQFWVPNSRRFPFFLDSSVQRFYCSRFPNSGLRWGMLTRPGHLACSTGR